MKNICFYILCFGVMPIFAQQKQDLKSLCAKMDEQLNNKNGIHLEYAMIIRSREDTLLRDTMNVSYKKSGKGDSKIIMGKERDVIAEGNLVAIVGHSQKTIILNKDTSAQNNNHAILGELIEMVDSASSLSYSKGKGTVSYVLLFENHPIYTKVILTFLEKTKSLKSVYSEFRLDYPEPYYSLTVNYNLWDFSWMPENKNFPNLNDVVDKQNGKYVPTKLYEDYRLVSQL